MKLKNHLLVFFSGLRRFVGRIECRIEGRCHTMASEFEVDPECRYFYACQRCGRDVATGKTLREWFRDTGRD